MTKTLLTVFLVDDDAQMREAIHMLLQSVGLPIKTYGTAQEFLNQFDPEAVGCLVLDIRLPGMSGLELQQRLRELNADLPVILLSGHADVPMAVRGIKAGAIDFLEKPFNDQVLLDRIQQGVEEHLQRRKRREAQREVTTRMETLTPREREVMELLVSGMSNKSIAAQLHISRKTLDIHRGKVLQKMEAETVADLVRLVLQSRRCCYAAS
jgi:FixJ family two-component response regulator